MKKSAYLVLPVLMAVFMFHTAVGQQVHSLLPDPAAPDLPVNVEGEPLPMSPATIPGYFYKFTDDNFYTFPVPGCTPQTVVGSTGAYDFYAGDFGPNGILYAIDVVTGGDYDLYSIDPATGNETFIVAISGILNADLITGMTYHEASNTVYISSADPDFITGSQLYTLNVGTGVATLIGPITNCPGIIFLAVNCEGELYGVDIVDDNFLQIDPSTAAGTIIGPIGFNVNNAQGADFDDGTGILYWAAYPDGNIRTINLQTGASTVVTSLIDEVDVFTINGACPSPVPSAWWSLLIGVVLIGSFIFVRYTRLT